MTERRLALFRVVIGLNIDRHRQTDRLGGPIELLVVHKKFYLKFGRVDFEICG